MGVLDIFRRDSPLVAAVNVVNTTSQVSSSGSVNAGPVAEAWRVWRKVGEIHYATTQQARLASRLDWTITVDDDEQDADYTRQVFRTAFGPDWRDLVRKAMIHLQVAGGYYLIQTGDEWDIIRYPATGKSRTKFEAADIAIRVVNEDPEDSSLTDSPVMAAIDPATELILLRQQSRSTSRNRTAQLNTVLYPLEGAGPDRERFERELATMIAAPLADEHSASVVVPNIIGFPAQWIADWRTLDLTGPVDERLHEKIPELVRQVAVILDIPPDLVTGMADMNHWSAWAVQEDNWLGHVEPIAKLIGSGLAAAISTLTGNEAVRIDPDPAPLMRRRPAVADVMGAFDRGLVSDTWAREQIGADDTNRPVEIEVDSIVQSALDMVRSTPSLVRDPGLPYLIASLRQAIEGTPIPDDVQPLTAEVEVVGEPGGEGQGPASAEPQTAAIPGINTERLLQIDVQAEDAIIDLIDAALYRVREKVGARIRSTLQGDPDKIEQYRDVPNVDLPREGLTVAGQDDLVRDVLDSEMTRQFVRILDRARRATWAAGVGLEPDEQWGQDAYVLLVDGAESIAPAALAGDPTRAKVWELGRRTLTVAGGGDDPAPMGDVAARPSMPSPLAFSGIALGKSAGDWIIENRGVEPTGYIWEHIGGGATDHPEHVDLDGVYYDGTSIHRNGVDWYIGDHEGCRCRAVPQFGRAS